MSAEQEFLDMLARRRVVTYEDDPDEPGYHCGMPRDTDGFCQNREGHPILFKRAVRLPDFDVECIVCDAEVGRPCVEPVGRGQQVHEARHDAWLRSQGRLR